MKIYIPFNMIVDTDFGVMRLIDRTEGIESLSKNKAKSFLLKRKKENFIEEYNKLRELDVLEISYDVILDKYYDQVLQLSEMTDMLSFVLNTYKLGLSKEVKITIGCDTEEEIEYLKSLLLNLKYKINYKLNTDIKLDEFDSIFIRCLDFDYTDYLLKVEKISAKRLYVADYGFNTLYDRKSKEHIIDPYILMELESEGNIVSTVSLYNKK